MNLCDQTKSVCESHPYSEKIKTIHTDTFCRAISTKLSKNENCKSIMYVCNDHSSNFLQ